MMKADTLNRRGLLAGLGLICTPGLATAQSGLAAAPAHGNLHFEVWREGHRIGAHSVGFHSEDGQLTATINAELLVKIGPIPVFRYRHEGTEIWRGGRFASLETRSVSNGKVEQVSASRTDDGVLINTLAGRPVHASSKACPLTHWNPAALSGPLFNPQTGALLLHEAVSHGADTLGLPDGRTVNATRYELRGEAEIADWYDPGEAWIALRGKAQDGSSIEYRRV